MKFTIATPRCQRLAVLFALLLLPVESTDASTPRYWRLECGQAQALFGMQSASAGDVNHDGYDDIIIGAPLFDHGQVDEGRALLFYGSEYGPSGTPSWYFEVDQAEAWLGRKLAGVGDVNADGYDDVVIAAYRYDGGQTDEGKAWLFPGSPEGLSSTPAWSAESNSGYAEFGVSVSGAGDVNSDGYDDVVIGAWYYSNGQAHEGRAYLYLGCASGLLAAPAWTYESNNEDACLGHWTCGAGDINSDGYDDVIIGAYLYSNDQWREGRAYMFLGCASGLSMSPSWIAEGNQADAHFASRVSPAGDCNHDGYADVLISAELYDNGEEDEGKAFVYCGGPTGLSTSPVWSIEGNQANTHLGIDIAGVGDVDGDGVDDIAVGANDYDGEFANGGLVRVYRGSSSGIGANPFWTLEGDSTGVRLGRDLAFGGDVDGDGIAEVLISRGVDNPLAAQVVYVVPGGQWIADGQDVQPFQRTWSTLFGGSLDDHAWHLAFDQDRNILVVGGALSANFPVTADAFDKVHDGVGEAFIAKLDPTGTNLLAATFFGGSDLDYCYDIAMDANGSVLISGVTYSDDLPTTDFAYDRVHNGGKDFFVGKFSSGLDSLLWCTYVGGTEDEEAIMLQVGPDNQPIICGHTESEDFPTTAGAFQETFRSNFYSGFVAQLSADGSSLLWNTFISGTGSSNVTSPVVLPDGSIIVCGSAYSEDFPTTAGSYDTTWNGGECDSYVAEFSAGGTLIWSTFIGGNGFDNGFGVFADSDGSIVLAQHTTSTNSPTSAFAYSTANSGGYDGHLARLSPDGGRLLAGTYLGGTGDDIVWSVARGDSGYIWLAGYSSSTDFPLLEDAPQPQYGGGTSDAFLAGFSGNLSSQVFGTYLGGSQIEYGGEVAVSPCGTLVVCGQTASSNFPTTPGAYDETHNGGADVFVAAYSLWPLAVLAPNGGELLHVGEPDTITWDHGASCAPSQVTIELLRGGEVCALIADEVSGTSEQVWTPAVCAGHWGGYRIRVTTADGCSRDVSDLPFWIVPPGVTEVPAERIRLAVRARPNPFNPRTTIGFDLPVGGRVHLEVYDVAGRLIRTLLDVDLPAGSHQAVWDGKDAAGRGMPSGSYFARLSAGGRVETVRMGLVR